MTYDKIFKYGTCKESQYGYRLAQKIRFFCRDGNNSVSTLRNLETTGVSLRKGGRVCRQPNSGTRPEDCLHGQTLRKSLTGDPPIRQIEGTNDKRSGLGGFGNLTLQRSEEWLNQGEQNEQLSWNTALTDCRHERSAKPTSFLSQIKIGVPTLKEIM